MKIDIAESIREVLCDRQAVSIYGLGTLCLKQTPAQFGDKRRTLLPPTMRLEFIEKNSNNDILKDWLVNKYAIKPDFAAKAIKKFSQSVLNTLLNYGKVYIPGIALFDRNENNELVCDADSSLTSAFYRTFPVVELHLPDIGKDVLAGDKEEKQSDVFKSSLTELEITKEGSLETSQEESQGEAQEESQEELQEEKEKDIQEGTQELESFVKKIEEDAAAEEISAEDMIVFDIESEIQKLKQELETEIEKKEGSSFPWRKVIGSSLILISFILVSFVLVDACNNMKGKDKLQNEQIVALDAENIEAQDSLSRSMLAGDEMSNSFSLERCIIITGVFSSSSNVDKMTDKIEASSYTVYTEMSGIYTRIGLEFDCSEVDLEDFIQQIRKEISPKAWYLNPELYVAYSN